MPQQYPQRLPGWPLRAIVSASASSTASPSRGEPIAAPANRATPVRVSWMLLLRSTASWLDCSSASSPWVWPPKLLIRRFWTDSSSVIAAMPALACSAMMSPMLNAPKAASPVKAISRMISLRLLRPGMPAVIWLKPRRKFVEESLDRTGSNSARIADLFNYPAHFSASRFGDTDACFQPFAKGFTNFFTLLSSLFYSILAS